VSGVRRALTACLLAVLLLLGACGGDDDVQVGDLHGSVLDPPFDVAGDELQTTDGQPYSLTKSTDKRLTLLFFGYTRCDDVCPAVLANLASAMTRLSDSDRKQVDVVFATTDPAYDTPEIIRSYLDRYDKSFIGVTGSIEQLEDVAGSVAAALGTKQPDGSYQADAHTTQVTGIDSDDQAPIYWSATTSSAQFAQDIHTLLGKP
jgi:protein SCO1